MAKKDAWLAYETSTTTGTGPYQLSGEVFDATIATLFASVLVDGDQTIYVAHGDGNNFEANLGTWDAATNELSRDQHLFTTNGGDSINWGAGTKGVYAIQDPILSAAFLQTANNLSDVNDAASARNNLGLGSAAEETATDFVDKRVGDQEIDGTVLRLVNTGFVAFLAEDDATTARARYGFRTGGGQGAIAHHDGTDEVDVMRFSHNILDFLNNPQNVTGLEGAVSFIRVILSADQTTDLDVGSNIAFDNSAGARNIGDGFTFNTGTGVITLPPGVWMAFLQVRALFKQANLGLLRCEISDAPPGSEDYSPVLTTRPPNEPFAEGQSDSVSGIIAFTSGSRQIRGRIANVGGGSGSVQSILSGFTQLVVIGMRRNPWT